MDGWIFSVIAGVRNYGVSAITGCPQGESWLIQWTLSKADTLGTCSSCPPYGGVRFKESLVREKQVKFGRTSQANHVRLTVVSALRELTVYTVTRDWNARRLSIQYHSSVVRVCFQFQVQSWTIRHKVIPLGVVVAAAISCQDGSAKMSFNRPLRHSGKSRQILQGKWCLWKNWNDNRPRLSTDSSFCTVIIKEENNLHVAYCLRIWGLSLWILYCHAIS